MGDIVSAVGDLFGASSQSDAQSKAASQQAAAAQQALSIEQNQYAQTRQDESPWRVTGEGALQQLSQLYGLNVPTDTYSDITGGYGGNNTGVATTEPALTGAGSAPSYEGVSEGGLSSTADAAILSGRPDVQSGYDALSPDVKSSFGNNPNNYANYWYNRYGQSQGYTLPASATAPPASAAANPDATGFTAGADKLNIPTDASGTTGAASSPFWASPDYNFALQQGEAGVMAGQAAGGQYDSGATDKAETQYAENLASGQYQSYVNNLTNLSNSGQAAAGTTATAGTAASGQEAATTTTAGNNAAASTIAQGNISSTLAAQLSGMGSSYANNNSSSSNPFSQLLQFAGG